MSSFVPFSLDLNLALPTQTWGQEGTPVWMPYFAFTRGPVRINDSLLLDNEVAIGVAMGLVTPRDVPVLGTSDDNRLVSDSMALSVQSTAFVASMGHRLTAKYHEVQEENEMLSKMVNFHSNNMQKQLEALENPGMRKRDHERSSKEKGVVFGGSSDEPQEAMRENPKEDIERAKLKSPVVEK
ncbi:hypothetical protein L3X38_025601 [Prunus dulcis]|uniref:Uncharacterized protein n=1 Tax=Prunus dulcis TaxID=3755 RepID=A0AAD4Z857_PRUDU|nr:hypothetical protein L3X38_025601 [Prunus dulcis]